MCKHLIIFVPAYLSLTSHDYEESDFNRFSKLHLSVKQAKDYWLTHTNKCTKTSLSLIYLLKDYPNNLWIISQHVV
jgi:hypothetical protein